jgi:DNA integrity scanning protein DisA with diadenylate cyclase activity
MQTANVRDTQTTIDQLSQDLQRYGESLQQTVERLRDLEVEWLAAIAKLRNLEKRGEGIGAAEVEAYIEVLCKEFRVISYKTERFEKVQNNARKMLGLLQENVIKDGKESGVRGH